MNYGVKDKIRLIPTDFATREKQKFWKTFNLYMPHMVEMLNNDIWWVEYSEKLDISDFRMLYCNNVGLKNAHLLPTDVIGEDLCNGFFSNVATAEFVNLFEHVIKLNKRYEGEYSTSEVLHGKTCHQIIVDPIYNPETDKLVGFLGLSANIISPLNFELLNQYNDDATIKLIDDIYSLMNSYRAKINSSEIDDTDEDIEIKLTFREKQILYYLSHNRTTREIAAIISQAENKQVSHFTIHSLISKKLYAKFKVNTRGSLTEKALKLGLIPASLDLLTKKSK